MLGLFLYLILMIGLGALLPLIRIGTRASLGSLCLGGYALMIGIIFVGHVVLQIPMSITVWGMAIFALLAIMRRLATREIPWRSIISHPCLILPVFAALAVKANGGIDYQPFAIDEFTNWIGMSRLIYFSGGYEAVRESIYLPGYTPGWRLALTIPWFFNSTFAPGQSAAAPFILHVGLAALFFDIIRHAFEKRFPAQIRNSYLVSWLAVMLYLTVQATGALWTYTLLIEQPQIYIFAGLAFLLYLLDEEETQRLNILFYAGLVLMLGYLMKTATLIFVPGLLLAVVLPALRNPDKQQCRIAGIEVAIALGPLAVSVVLWMALKPAGISNCLSAPLMTFSAKSLAVAAALDWQDLLRRFSGAVFTYLAAYKWPVSVCAVIGAGLAVAIRKPSAVIAIGVFTVFYMAILYWFHLACYGPYYFEKLASIERFTRVALQPIHAIGLLAFAIAAMQFLRRSWLDAVLGHRFSTIALACVLTALFSWQSVLLARNVDDMTTRSHQNVDFRIAEVAHAAEFIATQAQGAPTPPVVQFISQGTDADILGYAEYYSIVDGGDGPKKLFQYAPNVSWGAGKSANVWQLSSDAEALRKIFGKADIIWPVITDAWIDGVLHGLIAGETCAPALSKTILIRRDDGQFECRRKP